MSLALLRHPKILEYSGIWMDTLRGGETQLTNTNKMLKSYAGITGLKTGTTNGAGVCISASAVRGGMGLLAVVLGSPSSKERFASATAMLDYGFATFEAGAFPQIAGRADTLRVTGGVEQQVALDYTVPEKMLLKKRRGPDADGGRCASGKAGRTCGGRHAGGFRNAEGGGRNTG